MINIKTLFKNLLDVAISLLAITIPLSCLAERSNPNVPDFFSVQILDKSTATPVSEATIGVYIREQHRSFAIGPEGIIKPKINEKIGTRSGNNGEFYFDLTKTKKNGLSEFPNENITINMIYIYKKGYLDSFQKYTANPQTIFLEKE